MSSTDSESSIAPLLRAEARQDIPACAAALRDLARTLRDPARGGPLQAELTDWLLSGLDRVTPAEIGSAEAWGEAVWDAAVDVVADVAQLAVFLETVAERLEHLRAGARPNLLSMLRARAHWRARDRMRRLATARLKPTDAEAAALDAQTRLVAALAVQRIARRFEADPRLMEILERLLHGETISEVSQATGLSRQAIYRALKIVRDWLAAAPGDGLDTPFDANAAQTRGAHV
jgi:DNA-binding transcriptional ArsR family regulator